LTGAFSASGNYFQQAYQLATDEVNSAGGLDVNRIEEVLSRTPAKPSSAQEPMSMAARQQLLQLALSLADRTL